MPEISIPSRGRSSFPAPQPVVMLYTLSTKLQFNNKKTSEFDRIPPTTLYYFFTSARQEGLLEDFYAGLLRI